MKLLVILLQQQVSYPTILVSVIISFVGAMIAALVTIWYKRRELDLLQTNQKHTHQLDDDKLKATIIGILDEKKAHELNERKHDFDQLRKALELAESTGNNIFPDKITGLKEYLIFIEGQKSFKEAMPYFDDDEEGFNLWAGGVGFRNAKTTSEFLGGFYTKYSHAYPLVAEKVNSLRHRYVRSERDITDSIAEAPESKKSIIASYANDFIKLRDELDEVAEELKQEFKELDQLKRNYISAHSANHK